MLLLVGGLAGAGISRWLSPANVAGAGSIASASRHDTANGQSGTPRDRFATLVSVTNCSWDQKRSTADLRPGGILRSGESLHLLEGVAEVNSTLPNGDVAMMHLEGPLAMTLSSQGMPSLLYGRLTGQFVCNYDHFTFDTPLGRVVVSGEASIGVMAAANKVELHVFSGAATLEPWEIGFVGSKQDLTATAGDSRLRGGLMRKAVSRSETGKSKKAGS